MCWMSWKSGSLNLLEPSGPHRAYYVTSLTCLVQCVIPVYEYMNVIQRSDDMACWIVSLNQLNVSVLERWGWQRASYIKQLAVYIKPLMWLCDWNIQAFIINRQYTELMHSSVFCFVMALKNNLLYQIVLKKLIVTSHLWIIKQEFCFTRN
jgi:hypothetical protein